LLQLGVTVSGVWFGGFAQHNPKKFHNIIEQLVGFLDDQFITPSISEKFTLDQVNKALEHVDNKSSIGKIVLVTR